jgi:acyl dehydratase
VALADVPIDRDHLASYADICAFRHSDVLPPTYPHVLAFPLAVTLMVDPSFPFALPGLIHVANRITQTRALGAGERLALRVRASDLRAHPRGRQFDMVTEVTVNGESVWTEASTYLHRESPSPSRRDSPSPSRSDSPFPSESENPPPPRAGEGRGGVYAIWRIPRNIGRRYAAVSGDVNPIHLNPLAAHLFGFRRAIAHGMWVKARCLAGLEGRLPDALTTPSSSSPRCCYRPPSPSAVNSRGPPGRWPSSIHRPAVRT